MDNWASIATLRLVSLSLVCYMPLARSARRLAYRGDTRADINRCGVAIAAACIAAVAQLCKTGCSP